MRKRRLWAVTAVAAALVLGGCSGSSDTGTTQAKDEQQSQSSAEAAGTDQQKEPDQSDEGSEESTDSIRDQLLEKDPTLSADEWESLRAEGGFDKDGYKEADYDEIMEAGKPCDGWNHFSETGEAAAKLMEANLKAAGVELFAYEDEDAAMNNYYLLNSYGEVYSYFETNTYYMIEDDSYPDGFSGRVIVVSDTVTGDLLYVAVYTDDVDALKQTAEAFFKMTGANLNREYLSFSGNFKDCIESGDGEGYLEVGDIWFDIFYEDEPSDEYFQYEGYLYMGDE